MLWEVSVNLWVVDLSTQMTIRYSETAISHYGAPNVYSLIQVCRKLFSWTVLPVQAYIICQEDEEDEYKKYK